MTPHNWERTPKHDTIQFSNFVYTDSYYQKAFQCVRCGMQCVDKTIVFDNRGYIGRLNSYEDCDIEIIKQIHNL